MLLTFVFIIILINGKLLRFNVKKKDVTILINFH